VESLRTRALSSLSWSVVAKLVSQGATVVGTVLLARILRIADFGLVAMAQIYLGFLQQFLDAGFLLALIQRPSLTQRELSGSFWLLLVTGSVGCGATVLGSSLVDAVFGAPGVGRIIAAQSTILLFLPFRTIGQAILSRDVRVDEISKREAAISVIRVALSIWLAMTGAGVWSLILPQIVAEIAFSLSCYRRAGWHPTLTFSWRTMQPLLRYGADITLSRLVWFGVSRTDQFVVGRVLGPTALGLYALAWQFAGAVPQFVAATLARVVFPVFSRLQGDAARLRGAFLDVTRYTAFAVMAPFAGLALVAPDLVDVSLKRAWGPAVLPMQLLCPLAFVKIFEANAASLINARAGTRRNLALNVLSLGMTALGVGIGARVGSLAGVAAFLGLASLPVTLLFVRAAMRECGGTVGQWLAAFHGPAVATLVMGAAVIGAQAALAAQSAALRLPSTVTVGMAAYALAVLLVGRDVVAQLRLVRQPTLPRELP
jgi:O-antigen/teichoic acid export membrane protein